MSVELKQNILYF